MSDEAIRARIRKAYEASERGEVIDRGDFSQYLEDLNADAEPVSEAGEGGSATAPADVPELG